MITNVEHLQQTVEIWKMCVQLAGRLHYQQLNGTCRLENPEIRDPLFSVYNLSSEEH